MNIVIVGGGFAGRWAACSLYGLARGRPGISVILFDRQPYTTMYPALPPLVGGEFGAEEVTGETWKLVPPFVELRREQVTRIDLRAKTVQTSADRYPYDYLVIACGSKTNLHGFNQSLEAVHMLDGTEDAVRMSCGLADHFQRHERPACVIVGGSYTGVELACAVYRTALRYGRSAEIVIVEAGKEALALLDARTREYALNHIHGLGFRVITGSAVASFDGRTVKLKTGEVFEDAFLCWCAGTKRAIDDIDGDFETLPDGRILVNEYLQVPRHPEVFAPADTGAVRDRKGRYAPKAVNVALHAGERAGRNLSRLARGKPLLPFHPPELGEVLPLYNTAAGVVLGKFVTGKKALSLHYFMTGYRNYSAANRLSFFARTLVPAR